MNNVTAYIGRDFGRGEWSSKDVVMATLDAMQDHGIEGATFTEAVGFWNGEAENSIRVEMLGVDVEAAPVVSLNSDYVMSVSKAAKKAKIKTLTYEARGPEKPIFISGKTESNDAVLEAMIMPVRM